MDETLSCLVDARWMTGKVRGMGRYAAQLITPIRSQCVFATSATYEGDLPGQVISCGNSFFPLWEQKTLPKISNHNSPLWMLCPYNTAPITPISAKLILVVHDLIFLEPWSRLPPSVSLYQNLGRLYRRFIVPRAIGRAEVLLTVSNYTKQVLIDRYGIGAERIKVIPNSLDDSWFDLPEIPLNERDNYLLSVVGEAPSKNVKRLLSAFALYAKRVENPLRLKLVGISVEKHADFLKVCERLNIKRLVEFVGYIDDAELKAHYCRARAFIFPSLYEGFGIPLLESMATKVPIACSNTTSLPEVVGDSAIQFDPRDVNAIADSIVRISIDDPLRQILVDRGFKQVQKYRLLRISSLFEEFWTELGII